MLSQSEEQLNYQPDVLASSVSASAIDERYRDGITSKPKPFRSEVSLVLAQPGTTDGGSFVSSHPTMIGFEKFNLNSSAAPFIPIPPPNPPPPPITENFVGKEPTTPPSALVPLRTSQIRNDFLKGPSHSLNELSTTKPNPTTKQHSKDPLLTKRRSLDQIMTTRMNERPQFDTQLSEDENSSTSKHHEKHKKPESKKFIWFRRPKKEKPKSSGDDDMIYNPLFAFDQMRNTQSLRGAVTNGKVKKLTMKDSPFNRQQARFRLKTTDKFDKFSRKYSLINTEEEKVENHENSVEHPRLSMSDEKYSNNSSSRESSDESFRSRKFSITSNSKQSGDKIPWCGCWGNGCF